MWTEPRKRSDETHPSGFHYSPHCPIHPRNSPSPVSLNPSTSVSYRQERYGGVSQFAHSNQLRLFPLDIYLSPHHAGIRLMTWMFIRPSSSILYFHLDLHLPSSVCLMSKQIPQGSSFILAVAWLRLGSLAKMHHIPTYSDLLMHTRVTSVLINKIGINTC